MTPSKAAKAFTFAFRKDYSPYLVQGKTTSLSIGGVSLYAIDGTLLPQVAIELGQMASALDKDGVYNVTLPAGTFQSPSDVVLMLTAARSGSDSG